MPKYVPPRGPQDARIMIIGEAPGENEEREGIPFCGAAGYQLSEELQDAGINEADCFITNVLRFRPKNNDLSEYFSIRANARKEKGFLPFGKYFASPILLEHFSHLEKEIEIVQPNVIIAFGNLSLYACTGNYGIMKWRGSVLSSPLGPKIIPVIHPAKVLRQMELRHLNIYDLTRANRESKFPELIEDNYNFQIRPSFQEALSWLSTLHEKIKKAPIVIANDIETRAGQIACVGFATSKLDAFCIPFMCIERQEGYWSLNEEIEITSLIRKILTNPNARWAGQNFHYDAQYYAKQWGIFVVAYHDAMHEFHTLFPGEPKSLGMLGSLFCEHPKFWKDEGKEWKKKQDEDTLWKYCCKDCAVTYEVTACMDELLEKSGLTEQKLYQRELFPILLKMMLRGIKQDSAKREENRRLLKIQLDHLHHYITTIVGHHINVKSPLRLKQLFFSDLAQQKVISRKSGVLSVDEESLITIAKRTPVLLQLCNAIIAYRSMSVFQSTFFGAKIDHDKRLHTFFAQAGTETFRLSSKISVFGTGANLQNIPKGKEGEILSFLSLHKEATREEILNHASLSPEEVSDTLKDLQSSGFIGLRGEKYIFNYSLPNVRRMFLADEGMTLLSYDLQRADLQVVVWEADDAELKQMLREGVNIHKENAKLIGFDYDKSKKFVHLTNYGGGSKTCAIACGLTIHEAEEAQKRWFQSHPGILDWHLRTEMNLKKQKMIKNAFGFRRFYFGRTKITEALAWVPQSTVGIVLNKGIIQVEKAALPIEILLQVHDEAVFQVPSALMPQIAWQIKSLLEIPIPYSDPLVIPYDVKQGPNWGDLTKLQRD